MLPTRPIIFGVIFCKREKVKTGHPRGTYISGWHPAAGENTNGGGDAEWKGKCRDGMFIYDGEIWSCLASVSIVVAAYVQRGRLLGQFESKRLIGICSLPSRWRWSTFTFSQCKFLYFPPSIGPHCRWWQVYWIASPLLLFCWLALSSKNNSFEVESWDKTESFGISFLQGWHPAKSSQPLRWFLSVGNAWPELLLVTGTLSRNFKGSLLNWTPCHVAPIPMLKGGCLCRPDTMAISAWKSGPVRLFDAPEH